VEEDIHIIKYYFTITRSLKWIHTCLTVTAKLFQMSILYQTYTSHGISTLR